MGQLEIRHVQLSLFRIQQRLVMNLVFHPSDSRIFQLGHLSQTAQVIWRPPRLRRQTIDGYTSEVKSARTPMIVRFTAQPNSVESVSAAMTTSTRDPGPKLLKARAQATLARHADVENLFLTYRFPF